MTVVKRKYGLLTLNLVLRSVEISYVNLKE